MIKISIHILICHSFCIWIEPSVVCISRPTVTLLNKCDMLGIDNNYWIGETGVYCTECGIIVDLIVGGFWNNQKLIINGSEADVLIGLCNAKLNMLDLPYTTWQKLLNLDDLSIMEVQHRAYIFENLPPACFKHSLLKSAS